VRDDFRIAGCEKQSAKCVLAIALTGRILDSISGECPSILRAMQVIRLTLFLALAALAVAQPPAPSVWQMQESGTTAGLRGIDSVDGMVAWASGTGGTVLKTIDGGAHWTKCAVPDTEEDGATLDFRGVQAWDADTAVVMASGPGEKSRLYKTTDGCKDWALLFKNPDAPQGFFDSLLLPKVQNIPRGGSGFGLLLGDPVGGSFALYETRDGGTSWHRISDAKLSAPEKESAAFAASNSCIAGTGGRRFEIAVAEKGGSSIIHILYTGGMWLDDPPEITRHIYKTSLPIPRKNDSSGPFSLFLISRPPPGAGPFLFGVAVGGDYLKANDPSGTSVWTADGGFTWTASTTPPHGYRSAVQWNEALKAWITVGTNGSDISRDDGKTWQPLDDGNWNALSLPFVVGPNGRIARMSPAAK
jgi:hypothetical protein